VELPTGVRVKVPSLEIDGVLQESGTYGSTESAAVFKDDSHFAGSGTLRVGQVGTFIPFR